MADDRPGLAGEELPSPLVELSFRYGWCTLRLSAAGQDVTVRATTLHDSFTDLLVAVDRLAAGESCQSVLWGGEGHGWFLDLTRNFRLGMGLVVHEMAEVEWLRPGTGWRPVRGPAVFAVECGFAAFVRGLAGEVHRIGRVDTDATGRIEQWGWDYPASAAEQLLRSAADLGFIPP